MAELPDPLWTLGAVVLGGFLSIIGQVIADRLKFKQEINRESRNRLRDQLYGLQDQLMLAFSRTRHFVHDVNDPMKPAARFFLDDTELKNAIANMGTYTVRVGDDPLSNHVGATVRALFEATNASNGGAQELMEAHRSLEAVQLRIGELLHTAAPVDLGVELTRRWWSFKGPHASN